MNYIYRYISQTEMQNGSLWGNMAAPHIPTQKSSQNLPMCAKKSQGARPNPTKKFQWNIKYLLSPYVIFANLVPHNTKTNHVNQSNNYSTPIVDV